MKEFIYNTEIFGVVINFIGMFLIGYWKWGTIRGTGMKFLNTPVKRDL